MRLRLENIGIIEKADVEINGLTVIAGNNDSGKSTVGKIAYSLTKSFEDFERNYEKDKTAKLNMYFREIYLLLRESVDLNKYPELNKLMVSFRFYINIDNKKLFELMKTTTKLLSDIDIDEEKKANINKRYGQVISIFQETEPKRSKIIKSIQKILNSEFSNQIINISADEGRIEVYEGENKIINIIIKDNKPSIEEPNIDYIFPFDSSVFIETPFILDYKKYLELSKGQLRSPDVYHVMDLLSKLKQHSLNKEKTKLNISEIVNGHVYFDEENDEFFFQKNEGNKPSTFKIINTASGIKSLGILQLLENAGEFNKNLLLIIDEPEVHLHPEWQIEYAKILIQLVENGIKVIITSHSPYFIEAVNKYSRKTKIEKNVKFYLSEVINNGKVLIVDKTDNKDEVLDKLSKPFERLVFGD
ncbi:MAG: AAA family ATPase [Candidatus Methanoperedens sp.]